MGGECTSLLIALLTLKVTENLLDEVEIALLASDSW